ncbi:hypothetical protein [Pantoea ananatis]|uniref:hypothetical protein n=1 Tax=Pantoea ananas TaxID=553 RepID=UPI0013759E71|nr:hypothetical protein [Pantoea ananatis]NCU07401.1 hypothetical protein [Pantoea ananatis]
MDKKYNNIILSETTSDHKRMFGDSLLKQFWSEAVSMDGTSFISSVLSKSLKSSVNNIIKSSDSSFFKYSDGSDDGMEKEIVSKKNMTLDLLKSDDYIEGEITKTQLYLESVYKENPYIFREVFQRAWLDLFYLKNAKDLTKFLCIASCLDYDYLKDKADAIILAAAGYDDLYVNEASLRAAESWGTPRLASYLEVIRDFGIEWLDDYKKSVFEYLRQLQ